MRLYLGLFILILVSSTAHASAEDCRQLFADAGEARALPHRKFKSPIKGEPRIYLSRFTNGSYHEVSENLYTLNGGRFSSVRTTSSRQEGFRDDESHVHLKQRFALAKMGETGYLENPQDAKTFENLGASLETGQVTLWEVVRDATKEEVEGYPPELLDVRRYSTTLETPADKTPIKTGSLAFFSGQISERNGVRKVQLPWEKEEARQGQALDRDKYKIVWEWGRAGQDMHDEIAPLYSANSAMEYIELFANGYDLKDGYVMFHSFDKVNTRLYLSAHPGTTYPGDWTNRDDMLFLVPLKDVIARHPPSLFSKHVARIRQASGGKIGEIEALDLLIYLRFSRWQELDLEGVSKQHAPIILNDVSTARVLKLRIYLEQFGLDIAQIHGVMDYLMTNNPTLMTQNVDGKYDNASDSVLTSHTYQQYHAVEISNLDPQLAKKDPDYVMSVIFESYLRSVNDTARLIQKVSPVSNSEANAEAVRQFVKYDVKFGVSTSSPEVLKRLGELRPAISEIQKGIDPAGHSDLIGSHPHWFKDTHISIFTLEQIFAWARTNGHKFASGKYRLEPGYWHRQYFLSQGDLL